MNEKEISTYKFYMAVISGWLGLFLSKYYIETDDIYNTRIIWSMIFPLIIAIAWEVEYAVVTAAAGLAIFIPFYVYPDRGYANILTTMLYLMLFIADGALIIKSNKLISNIKSYLVQIVYGVLFIGINSAIYLEILMWNPTGYNEPIIRVMADYVLVTQNINFILSILMLTAIVNVLLYLPIIRKIYALPEISNGKRNNIYFMAAILFIVLFEMINHLMSKSYYSLISPSVSGINKMSILVTAVFIICDFAIYISIDRENSNKMLLNSEENYQQSQIEIIKLNEGLEKAVEERTEQLKQAYDDLKSFSYTVSHEFKTPMREIDTYISIIEEDNFDKLDEQSIEDMNAIKRICKDTIILAESIMNYSKIGYEIMNIECVDMYAIVKESCEELKISNSEKNIIFNVGDMPKTKGDKFLLKQAIFNILNNSIKFSSVRDVIKINIWGVEDKSCKKYYFKDNGVGYDSKNDENLFDLFNRAHNRSDFEGNGVGLATVKKIIERHNGKVRIEGIKDKGCIVTIELEYKIK